jgi:hypothetical protein
MELRSPTSEEPVSSAKERVARLANLCCGWILLVLCAWTVVELVRPHQPQSIAEGEGYFWRALAVFVFTPVAALFLVTAHGIRVRAPWRWVAQALAAGPVLLLLYSWLTPLSRHAH